MGAPKQKWSSEEDAALRAGVAKHGVGNWRMILKDPKFSSILRYRSNVDLKDKWRNINLVFTPSGSRENRRTATRKNQSTPKNTDHQIANSTVASDVDDEIDEEKPIASVSSQVRNSSNARNPRSRNQSTPKNTDHQIANSTFASDVDDEIDEEKPIASVSSQVWNSSNARKPLSRNQSTPKNTDQQIANSTVASDVDDEIDEEKPIASVSSQVWNSSNARKPRSRNQSTPKNTDHQIANSTVASDVDEEIDEEKPTASVSSQVWNSSNARKPRSRLNNIILESVKNLNEPTGSHKTTIANYIEEEYWPPSNFDRILSAKLKDLTTSGKLIQVNRKYRIAPDSLYSEERSPKMMLLEDLQREHHRLERDDSKTLKKSQVDAELARMATMTAEEAAYAAACAVAEAEALMAEAEAAAREAEAAEADAQAAQVFAEASLITIKNRNVMELMALS